jgi:hypothetical protein
MANLDYTIASGIKPIQIESPMNQLAQAYQLKNMQEASQMNALKMQEMQRGVEQKNRLRTSLSSVDINSPEANKLIEQAYLQEGDFGGLMAHRKSMAEMSKEQTGQEKAKSDLFDAKVKQSRQFLEGLDPNSPTAIPDFIKWHEANHKDPVLGPILAQRGVTLDSSRARIEQAIKSGRLADLIEESKLGIEKFAQFKPGMQKAAMEKFDQDYSDYVAAGGELTRSQFKESRNRQPAAAPVVAPSAEPVGVAPVDVNAPVVAAPVSRVDANNVVLTAAPRQSIDTTNYGGQQQARFASETESAAAAPAAASGKKLELPGIHPEAAKLYSTKVLEDKIKADAIQRVHELSLKSENKRSEMAQMQDDRAAAIARKDFTSARELQAQINKRNKIDETAPAVSANESALISKAILDGRLDPSKVNSRNMTIIARTLAMDPNANLKELAIDAASATAASKSLAVITANVLSASNEADNMIRIIRTYNPKVDRGQYPDLNAIQVAVDKKTGGTDIVALNTAINGAVNAYARAINPKGVATVSDKNHAREILNSAYSKGQLDTILNVMQEEMDAAKRSPGEAAAILKALRRPQSSGGAVDAAGRKTLTELLK